ncbi:hypothetical protein EJ08DRAFT_368728 [Tothia fuscella]|uniref:Uncharacterized protein n=1 Tax=Tothia fuscella TaxID=1048955 RepID=A0A9P4TW31_9PEZI|nr:hypothetical protein EJ08DRAFT_368728 [Tothia fuscella]
MSFNWDDLKAEMKRQAQAEYEDVLRKEQQIEFETEKLKSERASALAMEMEEEDTVPDETRDFFLKERNQLEYDHAFVQFVTRKNSGSAIITALEKEWKLRYEELGIHVDNLGVPNGERTGLKVKWTAFPENDSEQMKEMLKEAERGTEQLGHIIRHTEGFKIGILKPVQTHVAQDTWRKVLREGPLSTSARQGYRCLWWLQSSIARMDSFAKPARFASFFGRKIRG